MNRQRACSISNAQDLLLFTLLYDMPQTSARCSSLSGIRQTCAAAAVDVPPTSDQLIISFGEVLIDFVPTVSGVSLAEAPAFKKAAGGAPANVAVGIARLGGKAAFVGKTGEDEFGRMLGELLKVGGFLLFVMLLIIVSCTDWNGYLYKLEVQRLS
jgi:hypothetical protein